MSEDGTVDALMAAMRADRHIVAHGSDFHVELEGEGVRLTGDAQHIAAKRRALALAQQHFKGWRIDDGLRREVTKRIDDQELATIVGERLSQEPVFADYSLEVVEGENRLVLHDAGTGAYVIGVSARDEAVTLQGKVGSLTHRRLAEVIAWWTGACALVVNDLEIVPPEEDDDHELTDAVLMVLEKDPLIDAGQLHVGTAAGIVHVEGMTINEEQRHSVLEDIWLVPGVADVVDRIATHSR